MSVWMLVISLAYSDAHGSPAWLGNSGASAFTGAIVCVVGFSGSSPSSSNSVTPSSTASSSAVFSATMFNPNGCCPGPCDAIMHEAPGKVRGSAAEGGCN
eukprot:scaffold27521_cov30-Tisochrysis_lutea.AAC.11